MPTNVDLTSFAGAAKRVHGVLQNVVPDYNRWPFISSHPMTQGRMIGQEFAEQVILSMPAGFTNSTGGLTTMEQPSSASSELARARAWDLTLRDKIAYEILHSAAKEGEKAFMATYAKYVMLLKQAAFHRLELHAYNGGTAMAIADSGAGGIVHTGGATTATFVAEPADFIPAAFMGSQPIVDVWDNNSGTYTLLNTRDKVLVTSTTYTSNSSISMTLSGDANDLADIDTSQSTRPVELWYRGTRTASALVESEGMRKVAALTSGDTYLNIAVSSYPDFWSGSQYAAGGAITLGKVEAAVMQMANKGAVGRFIVCLSLPAYKDISAEVRSAGGSTTANVRTMADHEKQVMGSKVYELITSAGPVEIHASRFVPLGRAPIYVDDEYTKRVGSAECDKDIPGVPGPAWERLENETGVQVINYSHVRPWFAKPANIGEITGITFS